MEYSKTQRAPLGLILYLVGIATLAVAWFLCDPPVLMIIVGVAGLIMILAGLMFGHLTVRDEGEHLVVRFGPLRVFGTRISYAEMTDARRDRTSLIDGWGLHYIPWRGWTFNLWGFDCVTISLGKRIVRVGTTDPDHLVDFLKTKITPPNRPS